MKIDRGKTRLSIQIAHATADVAVRVRRSVVVHVEQPVILVLTIVTTDVQTRVGRVEVSVIREPKSKTIDCCAKSPNLGKRNG